MKILASSIPIEHWLTLMTCTICDKTPDDSPVYKCNYGHTICYPCFQNVVKEDVVPVCNVCGSEHFTRHDVSADFLRKLKTKPGIGRPHRYNLDEDRGSNASASGASQREPAETSEQMTVEQLFQLPSERLRHLFEECTKEKLRYLNHLSSSDCMRADVVRATLSTSNVGYTSQRKDDKQNEGATSRKPLRCPHDSCSKIIAISSFKAHYKYEHFDFPRFLVIRTKELTIPFDPTVIEYGKSVCIGIIRVVPNTQQTLAMNSRELTTRCRESDVRYFWIMVSGSPTNKPSDAYALIWLFTDCDEEAFDATLEVSSQQDMMTMTAFCRVNGIYESQNVNEVLKNLNCLYVTYGTMKSMLAYGPKIKLRMIVH